MSKSKKGKKGKKKKKQMRKKRNKRKKNKKKMEMTIRLLAKKTKINEYLTHSTVDLFHKNINGIN